MSRRRPAASTPRDLLRLDDQTLAQADWATYQPQPLDLIRPQGWHPRPVLLDYGDHLARTFMATLYPREAYTEFLNQFIRLSMPRRLSLWISPIPSDAIVSELNKRMERMEHSEYSRQMQGRVSDAYSSLAYADASRLREALVSQEIKVFDVTFLLSLFAVGSHSATEARLDDMTRQFLQEARGAMWEFRPTTFEQGSGFLSTMPLGRPTVERPRLLDSASVSATFLATSADIIESGGTYLGINQLTGHPIFMNLADTRLYPAAHWTVIAATRSGKTETIKFYLIQRRILDPSISVTILDPSPPIDYQRLSRMMGSYVRLQVGSPQRFNPCAIAYPAHMAALDPEDRLLLSRKVDYLRAALYLMAYPGRDAGIWSDEERPLIDPVIRSVYAAFGITDDPLSLIDPKTLEAAQPRLKKMPTLADIQAAFAAHASPVAHRIAGLLDPWITGSLNMFNGQTQISDAHGVPGYGPMEQPWLTLNIQSIVDNHKELSAVLYFIVGELIAQRMMQGLGKKIIVLDEAHVLFANADTALWVSRLYRMAAKLNTQIILITQSLTDMLGSPNRPVAGAEQAAICLQQSYVKLIMHQDSADEIDFIGQEFHIDVSARTRISHFEPGDGFLITHRFRALTYVKVPPSVHAILTTNPDEVQLFETHAPYADPLGGRIPQPAVVEVPHG